MLAARPRHFLNDNAAGPAIHPPHRIEQEHQKAPQRDEFELPLREMVIAWGRLMAAGANGCRALAGSDPDFNRGPVSPVESGGTGLNVCCWHCMQRSHKIMALWDS